MKSLEKTQVDSERESNWLLSYRKYITSQKGEEGIIEKIFEIIEEDSKWCVEFGAGDGKALSNTWDLIVNKGWSSIQIEAGAKSYKQLAQRYRANNKVFCIRKIVDFQGSNSLENILLETPLPKTFDLLSIDVDGNDYHIWDSLKLYSPRVVIIEFNYTIPVDIEFVQPRDLKVNQGSSLLSLAKLGKEKGYELVAATSFNAFFVKREYYDKFGIKDNSPSSIHREHKYDMRIFQLFDGTLVLSGFKRLEQHEIDIDQEKIQVLPNFLRKYPGKLNPFLWYFLRYGWKGPFMRMYEVIAGTIVQSRFLYGIYKWFHKLVKPEK